MAGTHYPFSRALSTGREHGRHFWTPVNTGHRDRQAPLLMTSFCSQDGCSKWHPCSHTAREHG